MWIPKGRRKVLYGQLRRELGEVFHELARLLEEPQTSDAMRVRAEMFFGMNYYRLGMHWDAEHHFKVVMSADETGLARLYVALLEVEEENWKPARSGFEELIRRLVRENPVWHPRLRSTNVRSNR